MKKIQEFKFIKFFLSLSKNQKILFSSLFFILLFGIFLSVFINLLPKKSKSILYFENSQSEENIYYENKFAKSGKIKQNNSAVYKFSEKQLLELSEFYKINKNFTIACRIELKNQKELLENQKKLTLSFLYKTNDESKRIFSSVNLSDLAKNEISVFDFGLSSSKSYKTDELPYGVEIFSESSVKIYDFLVTKARIGFDFTDEIPFFGSAANGGNVCVTKEEFDFSGGTFTFPVQWAENSSLPFYEISFYSLTDYGRPQNSVKIKVNAGGEILTFFRAKGVDDCVIQTSTLKNPFSLIKFNQSEGQIKKFLLRPNSENLYSEQILIPLKTDLGMILETPSENWRNSEFELYEWDRFPGVLFFDTKNYDIQAKFFTRLAYFVEKKGFIGQILTDSQIEGLHGYNAHDYSAESLANFFTKAEKLNVLNSKELLLKQILLKNGVIIQNSDGYSAGNGAVISLSKESVNYLRRSFLAHESWHGIYFIDENFRNTTSAIYYTIDSTSRKFIEEYWQSQPSLGYNPDDSYLMNNEFMAYIMQQPLSNVSKYFVHLANRGSVNKAIPELCEYVKSTNGQTFEDAAKIFDSFAFDNYGLACGRVHLISREN